MKVVDVQELSVENLVLQGKLCRLVFSSLLCRHSIDRSPYSVQVFEYDAFVEANELVYKWFAICSKLFLWKLFSLFINAYGCFI